MSRKILGGVLLALALSVVLVAATKKSHAVVVNKPTFPQTVAQGAANQTGAAVAQAAQNAANSVPDTTTTEAPPAPTRTLGVGDETTLQGFDSSEQMTVKLEAVHYTVPTDQFSQPDAGSHYVAVELLLKNTGSAVYNDSPDNGGELIGADDGQINSDVVVSGPYQSTPSTTIGTGEQRRVYVDFQVPNGEHVKQFQFTLDSGMADQTGEWHL